MPFSGLRVISLESRRAEEMARLIRNRGGDAFVAPSMREAPLADNGEAFEFAERLFSGGFDMMIFLTGVGTRALARVLATRWPAERFAEALRQITIVARGPKPVAALREMNVPVTVTVPAPNTWRELLAAIRERPENRIAVQEYGKSNPDLLNGLRARGADVTPVRVYQWALPEDLGPLREAVRRIVAQEAEVVLFTTSVQVVHLFAVAAEAGVEGDLRSAMRRVAVASIGPTTSEMLEEYGVPPDMESSQGKMGFLVMEASERTPEVVAHKRAVQPQ